MKRRLLNRAPRLLAQGPLVLTVCLATGQALGLVRTTVVARLLGTEVQGEAVIIGMITGFFASVFTLNAAWQLVQSPRHDDPRFLNSLHASTIARGVGASLLIGTASSAILNLAGYEDLILPMLLAALVPLLEGFIHLDAWRLIRSKRYRRVAAVELSGPICSVITALIALAATRSVWVIPIVAIGNSLGRVAASHVLAATPWIPRLQRQDVREILRFSIPLIPAGILYWVNLQGDKLVILLSERVDWLEKFDLQALGSYGTIAMLVLLPRGTIVKTMDSIVVPRIANGRATAATLRHDFHQCWIATLALSLAIALTGLFLARAVLGLALGLEYVQGVRVSPILIGAMGVQLFRSLTYAASTGMGTTTTVLVGNIARLTGIVLALIAASLQLGLMGLAYSVLIAEVIASTIASVWLGRLIPGAAWRVLLGSLVVGGLTAGVNLTLE